MGNKKTLTDLVVAILVFVLMLSGIYFVLRDIGDGKFCAGPLKTERVAVVESFNREGAACGSELVRTRNHMEVSLVSGTCQIDEEARRNIERPGETMPGLP